MVFIDAPGTGFGRIAGKDKEKAFYGVDQDAHAFSEFIKAFLTKYDRWNSPKYLFGESYGTPRSAVLSNMLQSEDDIDLNGVMLLSQILNFDLSVDGPESNPGIDTAYEVALPTYAATAWYHKKLPGKPKDLHCRHPGGRSTSRWAITPMRWPRAQASARRRSKHIAEKLHQFTGLPVAYILRANLRISGGVFEKHLQQDSDTTTGRLDTRFSGPTMDPLSKDSEYDPQSAAISSAYVSRLQHLCPQRRWITARTRPTSPEINVFKFWDFKHKQPGMPFAFPVRPNTMPDLAAAMKYNPNLKVFLAGGYFDLATPFYQGWYEMHHLPIPRSCRRTSSTATTSPATWCTPMQESLKKLHDDAAAFIRATDNLK